MCIEYIFRISGFLREFARELVGLIWFAVVGFLGVLLLGRGREKKGVSMYIEQGTTSSVVFPVYYMCVCAYVRRSLELFSLLT